MSILEWAKKEVERVTNAHSASVRDIDIMCYKAALDALTTLSEYDLESASMDSTLSILSRLAMSAPLTPITEDDFTAHDIVNIGGLPRMKELQMKSIHFSPRFPSLHRIEYLDGRIEYCDTARVSTVDAHDQQQDTFSIVLATKIIDELFPITLPYLPPIQKYIVTMERSTPDAGNSEVDTYAFLGIKTPEGDKLDIKRYYKDTDDGWVEITEQEFLSRKQRSLSPDQIKLERAARRVVRDYIKEHYDEEDIITGAIEMIRRKPIEHGWMWSFDTPQNSYIKVHYDSEKSLFRVYAFAYENFWEVNADEVLHIPHLNSRSMKS